METQELKTRETDLTSPSTIDAYDSYNGRDRNAFLFGFTPQAEIWNGRFAMLGFVAYLLWDLAGYSVVRDVLHLISYSAQ